MYQHWSDNIASWRRLSNLSIADVANMFVGSDIAGHMVGKFQSQPECSPTSFFTMCDVTNKKRMMHYFFSSPTSADVSSTSSLPLKTSSYFEVRSETYLSKVEVALQLMDFFLWCSCMLFTTELATSSESYSDIENQFMGNINKPIIVFDDLQDQSKHLLLDAYKRSMSNHDDDEKKRSAGGAYEF